MIHSKEAVRDIQLLKATIMNEAIYLGEVDSSVTSNYIKAGIIEDFVCERITASNLGKRYNLTEKAILQLIAEVLPDEPTCRTVTLVYISGV